MGAFDKSNRFSAASVPGVLMICFLFQAFPAHARELGPRELEYLREREPLVFISQTHYPPFEFIGSDGDHTGMCVELARWIATELGFKVRFTDASFKEAKEAVLSGKAHVLTSMFYSDKREVLFDFTEPVFEVPASIFVVDERPDIKDLQDLDGKTIAMQLGDYAGEFLESKDISFNVVYTENFAQATDLVIAGEADAVIGDEQIVLYHIFANDLNDEIKKVGRPLYIGRLCMAVKDPDPLLVAILDKGFELARQRGVIDRISRKWLGARFPGKEPPPLEYLPYMLAGAGVLVLSALLVWLWNIRLRSQVAARTAELAQSENTLRTILSASPVGIGLVCNRTLGWHNRAMSRMLGYEPGELEGRDVQILYADGGEMSLTGESIKSGIRQAPYTTTETRWVRKDGTVIDCLLRYAVLSSDDEQATAIAIAEDITERKRAERTLRRSEERSRAILKASPDPMVIYDSEGRTVYLNPAFTRVFGWRLDELEGRRIPFVPEDQKTSTLSRIEELFQSGRPFSFQTKRCTRTGEVLDVIVSAAGIKDSSGRMAEMIVNLTDITAIRQGEAERLRLSTAIDQAAEAIVVTDTDGNIVYANPAFEKISGYAVAEAVGQNPRIVKSGKHDDAFYRKLWGTITQGRVWNGRMVNKAKDGTFYEEEATISPVRNDAGEIVNYVAVKRDITREVQLESQLRQAQKMEAIGTMAGGIAHDFNNILSVVIGFTELGLEKSAAGRVTAKEHEQVYKAAQRARDLVQDILTFSHKAEIELKPLQLNEVLAQSVQMIERTMPKMIHVRLSLAQDLRAVKGDSGQLSQVLLNLSSNAADAMPEGGELRIETKNVTVQDRQCSACGTVFKGEFVLLRIADTGVGMDSEIVPNIFDPFFTTKEVGKGTGLGLSTVFGIVQAHGGHIVCRSVPKEGTAFEIYFPVPDTEAQKAASLDAGQGAEAAKAAQQKASTGRNLRGDETILLVDDEEAVRDIGEEVLTRFGYRPILAATGEEALEAYNKLGASIDLVILDISMPGMGGRKCLDELTKIDPAAKVVIASGYASEGPLKETMKSGAEAFIFKPYSYMDMLTTIRRILDSG